MNLESLLYELLPYFYGLGSVFCLAYPDGSRLLKASGLVLLIATVAILWRRWSYRRAMYVEVPHIHDVAVSRGPKARQEAVGR
jgi:hypothetical protein